MKGNRIAAAVFMAALFFLGEAAFSSPEAAVQRRVPESVDPAIAHLLAVVDSKIAAAFDPERVDPLIDFVMSPKKPGTEYAPGEIAGATAAYLETDLNATMERLLKLVFNPHIPSYLTVPSTVRLSYWTQLRGKDEQPLALWPHLDNLQQPVRIDGVEAIVNTPDLFSGAYYAYHLDRTLILMRRQGKTVLLSLSMQRGPSDVGKKGVVLGPDRDWNYLYTGQEGISKAGLGWVDSYMYDSFSVTAYVETGKDNPRIRCGIFKWLSAGWAGINMVRTHHIASGLERFFDDFKSIIEAPRLSDTARLTEIFQQIGALSQQALRQKARDYFLPLKNRYGDQSRLCRRWFEEAFTDSGHLAQMNRRELEAILSIEALKYLLGREHQIDVDRLATRSARKG
jgi:hypothetical protein